MTSHQFSALFVFALVASVLLQLWLALRQINHVRRHRNAVPEAFAANISLASHQRAADYTVVKSRFGMINTVFEAMVLLAFTLGGGIDALMRLTEGWFGPGILAGVAMIALLGLIQLIIGLPFSWHSTFSIEERFGFNQMSKKAVYQRHRAPESADGRDRPAVCGAGALADGAHGQLLVGLCLGGHGRVHVFFHHVGVPDLDCPAVQQV